MSKAIKVDDHVYEALDRLRAKGETFSQAVDELLKARLSVLELMSVLESQLKYREWQQDLIQRGKQTPSD